MIHLILKRLLWMMPTLLAISFISFALIQLPPGDYLTSYITALEETGESVAEEQVEALRQRYNLDEPFFIQRQVAQQPASLWLHAPRQRFVFVDVQRRGRSVL